MKKNVGEAGGHRRFRRLSELNLIDSFLFGAVLNDDVYGEQVTRIVLERILGRKLKSIRSVVEKPIFPENTELKGVRLDAYVKELDDGGGVEAIYNLEANAYKINREEFPHRSRFYQSKIAGHILPSGSKYKELEKVFVIFILQDDPFGLGRMKYTFKTRCLEVPELDYDDGSTTICLYTKGRYEPSEYNDRLACLLKYMEDSSQYNTADDDEMQDIHEVVRTVKSNSEKGVAYMTYLDHIRDVEYDAEYRGMEKGRREGRREGRKEGEAAAWAAAGLQIAEKDKIIAEQKRLIEELRSKNN